MYKQRIATTLIVALLIGGTVACTRSNSSEATTPQPSTSTSNSSQSQEREKNRQALQKQIEAVLTPDQAQQFQAKLKQGEKMRKALSALDLTSDQKTKVQEIFKTARAKRQEQHKDNPQ